MSTAEVGALTHRRVLRIALPIVLSNATIPILGAVDTGVVGQMGAAAPIGAVGIGAVILTTIYWVFGFLRMGTTGMVAQAKGAGDTSETGALLMRGLLFGATAGAVLLENYNAPNELRTDRGRWTERLKLKLIAEDLPQADNRVTLGEDGDAVITWIGHSDYAYAGIERAEAGLADVFPFPLEGVVSKHFSETEAHIQGTHRMGADAGTSVTDGYLRCHEVDGLFALGAGAYPTSSAANPTLTLSALSLRAARSV